jgi:NADH dehydrogenase (ubiquinone) 1 beta subcomplex subunit 7
MDPTQPTMKVTQKEMMDAQLPLHVRDYCAHVLIPLNKCRRDNGYMVWACKDQMHEYEICMHSEYERRRALKNMKDKGDEVPAPNNIWATVKNANGHARP